MNAPEVEDLTIVDGVKLVVGKTYLMKYIHTPSSDWFECKITRITDHGHAWGEGGGSSGIRTNGSYLVQPIPFNSNPLQIELYKLQEHTIGFFRHHASEAVELVVRKDGNMLKTISIGKLGGLTTMHVPVEKGIYKEFGQNRSLSDMLKNPFELDEIYKTVYKKQL